MDRKVVIFIHGIGPQVEGYSTPLFERLSRDRDMGDVHPYEVFYYDVFEMLNAKLEVEKIVEKYGLKEVLNLIIRNHGWIDRIEETLTTLLRDTVSHVLYFTLVEDARNAILNKFKRTLMKVIEDAKSEGIRTPKLDITVLSHSLGTAVAYMGLHSIISEEALGLQDRMRIQTLFTLAPPLGVIREAGGAMGLYLPHVTEGIEKPKEWNPAKGIYQSNVKNWYSFRHKSDPVASVVPLTGDFLDHDDAPPYVFDEIRVGNVHAFENYIEMAGLKIAESIL